LSYKSATRIIAETGEIADSYAAHTGPKRGLGRFQFGRHASGGNSIRSQITRSLDTQVREGRAITIAHAFHIGD
jgi:hypothetical protein